jgi:fructose-bisphosphate aldolase class II
MARHYGAQVEAEIGSVGGTEDALHVDQKKAKFTDPDQARHFIKLTRIDSLAVAIGTSHGAVKFTGKPRLEFKLLEQINEKCKIPLVLHGASSVPQNVAQEQACALPQTDSRELEQP